MARERNEKRQNESVCVEYLENTPSRRGVSPTIRAPHWCRTRTGDDTVHCSDTLHRAHPPTERPRKVVYSGFRLPLLPGDEAIDEPRYGREARADLTDVQDRIAAAGEGGLEAIS